MADPKVSDNRLSSKSEAERSKPIPWRPEEELSPEGGTGYYYVTTCMGDILAYGFDRDEAYLAAAAPELLEALKDLIQLTPYSAPEKPGGEWNDAVISRARSVISKATGAS